MFLCQQWSLFCSPFGDFVYVQRSGDDAAVTIDSGLFFESAVGSLGIDARNSYDLRLSRVDKTFCRPDLGTDLPSSRSMCCEIVLRTADSEQSTRAAIARPELPASF